MSTDLETRLRGAMRSTADPVAVPDGLEGRVGRRIRQRRHRRRAAQATGVLVVVALAAVALRLGGIEDTHPSGTDAGLGRWVEVAEAPFEPRDSASLVWTGEEVIVFGGTTDRWDADAAAYRPADGTWRQIADPPPDMQLTGGTWTGTEVVAFDNALEPWDGGEDVGAVYDPVGDSWRPIHNPAVDGAPGLPGSASPVWTGEGVLIVGRQLPGQTPPVPPVDDGAALFDPVTGTWRALARSPGPLHGGATWTGTELVAVTNTLDGGNEVVAYALDPAANAWRTLTAPPLGVREDAVVAWTGDEVVVAGGFVPASAEDPDGEIATGAAAFDPATNAWRPLPDPPIWVSSGSWGSSPVLDGRVVAVATGDPDGRPLMLDRDGSGWTVGAPRPGDPEIGWTYVATDDGVLAWDDPNDDPDSTAHIFLPPAGS